MEDIHDRVTIDCLIYSWCERHPNVPASATTSRPGEATFQGDGVVDVVERGGAEVAHPFVLGDRADDAPGSISSTPPIADSFRFGVEKYYEGSRLYTSHGL